MNKKKIVIVGCGIVGCIVAILLKQKKHDVLMYEKSGQIGGVLNEVYEKYCRNSYYQRISLRG